MEVGKKNKAQYRRGIIKKEEEGVGYRKERGKTMENDTVREEKGW